MGMEFNFNSNFHTHNFSNAKEILLKSDDDFFKNAANIVQSEEELNELLDYYSASKLKSDIEKRFIQEKHKSKTESYTQKALEKLKQPGVDASNIEMLLELIEAKRLPSEILSSIDSNSSFSKSAIDDLDKLYSAFSKGISEEDVFVPKFNNSNEALDELPIGEVCLIKGDKNISIKTDEDTIKELSIGQKAYLKLFPPVERYISHQGSHGDCYLISAIDSINQNPNSRHRLLEKFKENPDGTLSASLGDFSSENILKEIENNDYSMTSYTFPALAAFEILNEKSCSTKAVQDIENQKDNFESYKKFINDGDYIQDTRYMREYKNGKISVISIKKANNILKNKDTVFINRFFYKKEELDLFLSYLNNHSYDDIISTGQKTSFVNINRQQVDKRLEELGLAKDSVSNYARLVLERYKNKMDFYNLNEINTINECLPKEVYKLVFDTNKTAYSYAGYVKDIYKKIGFENAGMISMKSDQAKEKLLDTKTDCIFGASAYPSNEKTKFIKSHAYAIEPKEIDNERKFIVRNPHNTLTKDTISFEELQESFDVLHYADAKS